MALRIDDPESLKLILELSALTGETPEYVLLNALAERLERERLKKLGDDAIQSNSDEFASSLIVDDKPSGELLDYDGNGLST